MKWHAACCYRASRDRSHAASTTTRPDEPNRTAAVAGRPAAGCRAVEGAARCGGIRRPVGQGACHGCRDSQAGRRRSRHSWRRPDLLPLRKLPQNRAHSRSHQRRAPPCGLQTLSKPCRFRLLGLCHRHREWCPSSSRIALRNVRGRHTRTVVSRRALPRPRRRRTRPRPISRVAVAMQPLPIDATLQVLQAPGSATTADDAEASSAIAAQAVGHVPGSKAAIADATSSDMQPAGSHAAPHQADPPPTSPQSVRSARHQPKHNDTSNNAGRHAAGAAPTAR